MQRVLEDEIAKSFRWKFYLDEEIENYSIENT